MLKIKLVFVRNEAEIAFQKATAKTELLRLSASIKLGEFLGVTAITDTTSLTDSGVLLNQGYCDHTYLADDYVGDKRIL